MIAKVQAVRPAAGPDESDRREPLGSDVRSMPKTRRAVLAALGLVVLGGCKILPIKTVEEDEAPKFSGPEVVDQLWDSKVLPAVDKKANDIVTVLDAIAADLDKAGAEYGHRPADEGSPWSFIVKGRAVIKQKNTQSRAGTLTIEVATASGLVPVTIQIGPVIKGNALRDAMPFVNFQDFTNQIQFAEVGRAFNAHALTDLGPAIAAVAEGQDIAFTGAFSMNRPTDKVLVTPILLGEAK